VNLLALRPAYEFGGNSNSLVVIGGYPIARLKLVRGTADSLK